MSEPNNLTAIVRTVRVPDGALLTRETSFALALKTWGMDRVTAMPVFVNIAALAIAMRGRLSPLQLRRSVSRLVHGTDCHSLPSAAPKLLHAPVIVEAAKPQQGEVLFGDTMSLGCYPLDGKLYLVGLGYPDGATMAQWAPQWGESVDIDITQSPLVPDAAHATWSAWAREAARYLVLLGAIVEAEGSPVECVRERDYTRVRLRDSTAQITDDYEATVLVRGHLKRQPYGPAHTLRRWQWVAEYSARRWLAPKSVRIEA